MSKDTEDILNRLQELLLEEEQETQTPPDEEDDIDQFLRDFRLMDNTPTPKAYNSDRNDYNRELKNFAKSGGKLPKKPRAGKLTLVLGITACCLAFGIIGMLVYWMEHFL